ncbi:hypothetical protein BDW02DRAFT_563982 [Decorospora gaudefroyi]|uniref:Uncharacterized protein n=1 Tax=Decorospora gaudefroyi TaxID=184978 RepID=A0A6A5KLS3_9PLEO|nr:hypothetical protein BDW02DRAFT_563982 [Decorospora gaudefroyi]
MEVEWAKRCFIGYGKETWVTADNRSGIDNRRGVHCRRGIDNKSGVGYRNGVDNSENNRKR